MSTSFFYLPGTRSAQSVSQYTRRKRTKKIRELLAAGLPEAIEADLFKSKLAVVAMGPEDLPVEASDQSPSLVFRKPVVFACGKLWIDASFDEQPEHLRASFFSAAGISAFALREDFKELENAVSRQVKLQADEAADKDNIMRRTRNRSLMVGLSLLEAFAEEAFLSLGGSFSEVAARFGSAPHRLPQADGLVEEVLLAAWKNILQFVQSEKCPAPVKPLEHPFVSSRLSLTQTYEWPTWVELLEQDDPGSRKHGLYIPERLPADKEFPHRVHYDPRTWNLSSLDSVTAAAPTPIRIDSSKALTTRHYWEKHAEKWPFGGVALYAMHRSGGISRGGRLPRRTHNFCTCYLPAPADPDISPKQALTGIPAIKSPKNTKVVEICAAESANSFTSAWLELKTPYGRVHAICSSWLDQGEMLRLHEPYKAVLGFWVTKIEKIAPQGASSAGVYDMQDAADSGLKSGKMLMRFYAGKRGERTLFGKKRMQTLLARMQPGDKDSEIYLAVSEEHLLESGLAEGDFFQAQGYFIVESFAPLEPFAECLGVHERLNPTLMAQHLPFAASGNFNEKDSRFLSLTFKYALADDFVHLLTLPPQKEPGLTQPSCVRLFDEILAKNISAGQHAAFNVIAVAGLEGRFLAPDMTRAAACWFAHHGTNPGALFLAVKPLLAQSELWELDRKSLSKVEQAVSLASHGENTLNPARVFMARIIDQDPFKRRIKHKHALPDSLLDKYNATLKNYEIALYLNSAYALWGPDVWKSTFEERLETYVSRAVAGGIAEICSLIAMLSAESGLLVTEFFRFWALPGRIHDNTRRDFRQTALAALKLKKWLSEQITSAPNHRFLSSQAAFDTSSLGSDEDVLELVKDFDLWGYLGCRPFLCTKPIMEQHTINLENDQSGRLFFWFVMLTTRFMKRHPGLGPFDVSSSMRQEIAERVHKETVFVLSHSTPFIPELPSMHYGHVSPVDGLIVRYGAAQEPLQDASFLSIMPPPLDNMSEDSEQAEGIDFMEGELIQPVGIPYFSESCACNFRILSAAATNDELCGNLSVFLCDEHDRSGPVVNFLDIFWPYMKTAYSSLDVWKGQFYCVCSQLSVLLDDGPSDIPVEQTLFWDPDQPVCLIAAGTLTNRINNWGEVAGVSFDQIRVKIAALEGIVQNAELIAYHPSAARSDRVKVGSRVFFKGLCYGYVTEAVSLKSRKMMLN